MYFVQLRIAPKTPKPRGIQFEITCLIFQTKKAQADLTAISTPTPKTQESFAIDSLATMLEERTRQATSRAITP